MKNLYNALSNVPASVTERQSLELLAIDAERKGIIRNAYDVTQSYEGKYEFNILHQAFSVRNIKHLRIIVV